MITAADLSLLMALLPQYAQQGAKFYCSQYFFAGCFERLLAAGGGNKISDLTLGLPPYRYLGKDIVISQKMPSTSPTGTIAIYYGRLDLAAMFGDRRQTICKRSDERYFDTDQIGLLGTERIDINIHDVGSNAATSVAPTGVGPIVALKMG